MSEPYVLKPRTDPSLVGLPANNGRCERCVRTFGWGEQVVTTFEGGLFVNRHPPGQGKPCDDRTFNPDGSETTLSRIVRGT